MCACVRVCVCVNVMKLICIQKLVFVDGTESDRNMPVALQYKTCRLTRMEHSSEEKKMSSFAVKKN